MNKIIPMNDMLLVRIIEEDKKEVYFGENQNKVKTAEILAFSEKCDNKNFEIGKKVFINRYEMIPNGDSDVEFFVTEKAIIAMF
jgi:co-chaperonin GroES (HSP10)